MLKETLEILKALLEFLRSIRVVFAVFLGSLLWLLPTIRDRLPIAKAYTDDANLAASIMLILSGAYLVVSGFETIYNQVQKWRRSENRTCRKALAQASPLEKIVLEAIVHKGEYLIELDVGSPIAMHLQEIGLIERAWGLTYTTYKLAAGLATLCIRNPSLLHNDPQQQGSALAQIEEWRKEGLHKRFFNQFAEPSRDAWMR